MAGLESIALMQCPYPELRFVHAISLLEFVEGQESAHPISQSVSDQGGFACLFLVASESEPGVGDIDRLVRLLLSI